MDEIGIRALKQNASAVVARVAAGEILVITDRGRPVAQLSPIRDTPLARMLAAGHATPPTRSLHDLGAPEAGAALGEALDAARDDERY